MKDMIIKFATDLMDRLQLDNSLECALKKNALLNEYFLHMLFRFCTRMRRE